MKKIRILLTTMMILLSVPGCGDNLSVTTNPSGGAGAGTGGSGTSDTTGAISFNIDFTSSGGSKMLLASSATLTPFSNVEYRQRVGLVDVGLVSSDTGSLVSNGTYTVVAGSVSPTISGIVPGNYILKIAGKTAKAGIGLYKGEVPVKVEANKTARPEVNLDLDNPSVGILISGISGSFVSNATYTAQVISSIASGGTLTDNSPAKFDGVNFLFMTPLSLSPKTVQAVFSLSDASGKTYEMTEPIDILAVIDACESGHYSTQFEPDPGVITPVINFNDGGASPLSFLGASFYKEAAVNTWDPILRKVVIVQAGQDWQANLSWRPIAVNAGETYRLVFTCQSPSQSGFYVGLKKDAPPYDDYVPLQKVTCDGTVKTVSLKSGSDDQAAQIVLNFGESAGEYVFEESITLEKLI